MLRVIWLLSCFTLATAVIAQDNKEYYEKWTEYSSYQAKPYTLAGYIPQEITEIIDYLKDPVTNAGKRGYIFFGPPGTGKSTFAKAITQAVHGVCLIISGSDFEGGLIGTGPERIDRLFKRAHALVRYQPVIIFIDEIEAVGTRSATDGNNQYEIRTLDKLIADISNIPPNTPLIIIGATNHEKKLDPAIIREGRCKLVEVTLPDTMSRQAVLKQYATDHLIELPDSMLELLTKKTDGFNHAALEDLMITAAKKVRRFGQHVFATVLADALQTNKRNKQITKEKEEKESRRELLEKFNLSNAKIGWWSSVLTLSVLIIGSSYKIAKIMYRYQHGKDLFFVN